MHRQEVVGYEYSYLCRMNDAACCAGIMHFFLFFFCFFHHELISSRPASYGNEPAGASMKFSELRQVARA